MFKLLHTIVAGQLQCILTRDLADDHTQLTASCGDIMFQTPSLAIINSLCRPQSSLWTETSGSGDTINSSLSLL